MIRDIKQYVPKRNAIVILRFNYCSMVWDNCADYQLEKLQKLKYRAAREITLKSYEARSEVVQREMDWKPLRQRYQTNKLILIRKAKKILYQYPFNGNVAINK